MANKVIAATVQFNGITQAINSVAALSKELAALKSEQSKADPTSARYKELSELVALYVGELKSLQDAQKKVNQSFQEVKLTEGSYAALASETKTLTEQFKNLAVGVNATQAEYDELKAKIQANNSELSAMSKELKGVQKAQVEAIGGAANSAFELKKKLIELRAEQSKTDSTTDRYKELSTQIASTSDELKSLENEQKKVNEAFQEAKLATGSYAQLTAETKRLTAEFKAMKVGVNATQEEYDALLARIKANNAAITDMNREMRNSKSIAERFREGAVAAFKDIALNIAAGVTALEGFQALKGLGELGLDLERGFAQVNTVAQLSEEGLADLQAQVLETAKTSTANLEEVPGALFKILSATGDVAESQEILAASLRAAKVGFTDIGSASDAGTAIFGAFKGQVKDITEVFDVLFRTQKEGVLTFADLAKGIPVIAPEASKLRISLQETTAALATLTKAGTPVEQAVTQIKAGFKDLSDVAKIKGLKEIGVSVFDAAGNANTLNNIIGQLSKSLDGLTDEERTQKLGKIGFSGEATGSILTLVNNLKTFDEVATSIVEGSAGELERQFAASGNTLDDLKIAANELQVTLIQELQPAFVAVGRTLIGIISGFAKLIGFLLENKGVLLLLAAAYGALNLAQIQSLAILAKQRALRVALIIVDKIEAAQLAIRTGLTTAYGVAQQILTGRLTLAAAAQQLFNLAMKSNPVGIAVVAVTALAGALLIFANRSKEATAAERERARVSKEIDEAVKSTNQEIGKETANLELLTRAIKDENTSKEDKKRITNELLSQYGKYLSELDKEAVKAGEVEAAYIKIKQAITENIIARQKSEAVEKLFGEQLAARQQAAFNLTKAFGGTADEIIRNVDEFSKLSTTIQEAAKNDKLQLIDTDALSDAQTKAVNFFATVAAQQRKAQEAGKQSAIVTQLKLIQQSTIQLDAGLTEIETKFGALSMSGGGTFTSMNEGANAAAQSVAELELQLSELQKTQKGATSKVEWDAQEKEIQKVKAAIEAITGASKASQAASKKSADEIKKEADAEKEAAEKRANSLFELRRQLSDAILAVEDDETEKLLAAETDRYARQQQLALDNAAKVVLDKNATADEIKQATELQNQILEQLDIEHYQRLNEIAGDALKKEREQQEKADAEAVSQRQRINGLKLETVNQEIENEEKNFARRKELIQLQSRLLLQQLELETMASLKSAKTDAERTAIMENEAAKRVAILKDTAAKIKEEKDKEGPLLARILGISPEELQQLNQLFTGFTEVLNKALDNFFAARLEALDLSIKASQDRVDAAADAIQRQVTKIQALEERLATATGNRRLRLIALIEQEKKREAELFEEKVKQEKAKAALEAKRIRVEKEQAAIKKAQAIAEATINTAVSVTKVLSSTPPPLGPILAIGYGLLGAAQIALISAQKFAKGGKVEGRSHAEGGVKYLVRSTGTVAELEGGEHVTRVAAVRNNEGILARINAEGHNTRFSLIANDNKRYANGGVIATPNFQSIAAATTNANSDLGAKLDRMIELQGMIVDKPSYVDVREVGRKLGKVQTIDRRATT